MCCRELLCFVLFCTIKANVHSAPTLKQVWDHRDQCVFTFPRFPESVWLVWSGRWWDDHDTRTWYNHACDWSESYGGGASRYGQRSGRRRLVCFVLLVWDKLHVFCLFCMWFRSSREDNLSALSSSLSLSVCLFLSLCLCVGGCVCACVRACVYLRLCVCFG